jgi:hypothetical protein
MCAIVVDPLGDQLVDAERSHLRVMADAREVPGRQTPHEGDPVHPQRAQLCDERDRVDLPIVPRCFDGGLVPRRERGLVRPEDVADPAGFRRPPR